LEAELLRIFTEFTSNIHFCIPFENLFIYSHKPTKVHWHNRRLHSESGPAVEYADGWGWYCLNGIQMKPEYVITPADKLTPQVILAEKSVDIRRELIRKVGVMRMVDYGQVVNEVGDYKLVDMHKLFTGLNYTPFLLMKNPSVDDTFHLEGVAPECKTVQEAINWRAGNREIEWSPALLS
jgi:hypothetical protein